MLERTYTGEAPGTALPAGAVDTQMHVYLPGFPARPGGPQLPPDPLPTPEDYRRTMTWLGIDRVVITQGNAHQFDNSCLLACLDEMGTVAKGVAVITGETQDTEMQRLSDAGVVGARIMDLPGGALGLAGLEAVDARARAFGWMMAVQVDGSDVVELEPRLGGIGSTWVLDHHGKFFRGARPDGPEVAAVKRLIDKGNCWFKFAGCYESSRSGGPDYEDIAAVAREMAVYAPERIIWGTNWPHNLARTSAEYPNDAMLLDTVMSWFPSENAQKMALVDNPERLFGFAD